jgi:uncharacterized membrane protein YhhN
VSALKAWIQQHRYTTDLLISIVLVAAVGLGEWVTGYPQKAITAGFFMFAGLVIGHALGGRKTS